MICKTPTFTLAVLFVASIFLVALTPAAEAHVGLLRPCARGSPRAGCPAPSNGQRVDYDLNSPIGTRGSRDSPICKQSIPNANRPVYKAGETINTQYSVGASHGGGHCQWALSYDNGKTWVVVKTMLRDCLKGISGGAAYSVPVKIPSTAPSGKAIFMWLWNNAIGNRELYSNCADIEIKGVKGGSITGPQALIANYGSDSALIPEFGSGGRDDGSAAFNTRKTITVRA
ncbi:hypothetical protein BGW38_005265 [Lunasporangiospora selenospora]|uniref:Chitin-binding protein n=1 Tax=Lunasporangiospora selenospora TaxID=979761 RepID=A0A9P6FNZ1_9FUNG|nr:hypothetical protein BGW38_005265 [Lunasporangiospora selenospora]